MAYVCVMTRNGKMTNKRVSGNYGIGIKRGGAAWRRARLFASNAIDLDLGWRPKPALATRRQSSWRRHQ